VVRAEGSHPRGCGFEPWHRILDGCKRYYPVAVTYTLKSKRIKVAKQGTPIKYFKNNSFTYHTKKYID
jgi:hypothetical protein